MRWIQHRSRFSFLALATVVLSGLTALAPAARAAVTVTEVGNASAVEGVGTSTVTVYGGLAGSITRCTATGADDVCNTCVNPAASGDANLLACNEKRVHPNWSLSITFSSDATDGLPVITTNDASSPTALNLDNPPTSNVTKGTAVTLRVRWSQICGVIPGSNNSCTITGTGDTRVTLRVGMSADGNTQLTDAGDDYRTVSFVLAENIGQADIAANNHQSIALPCNQDSTTTPAYGVCHFSVFPGDQKVVIQDLTARNGFPNSTTIAFKKIRVFYTQDAISTINPASDHEDLDIVASGTERFDVTPSRVTNNIENDKTYNFKVAVIDAAGNIGYYTGASGDNYCEYTSSTNTTNCHTATPGEVVGILSKDMNCFIATAAYGSKLAPQVDVFRAFRNHFLLTNDWGTKFVRFYYEHSPKYAKIIAESPSLRAISRALLWPLLAYAWLSLQVGAASAMLMFVTVLLMPLLVIRVLKSRSAGRDHRA